MEKTWKPIVAGILNIIGGIVLFIVGTLIWSVYISCEGYRGPIPDQAVWLLAGTIPVLAGTFAVVGGRYALKRKNWRKALIGSFCAVISGMGSLTIVLLAWSKDEFE